MKLEHRHRGRWPCKDVGRNYHLQGRERPQKRPLLPRLCYYMSSLQNSKEVNVCCSYRSFVANFYCAFEFYIYKRVSIRLFPAIIMKLLVISEFQCLEECKSSPFLCKFKLWDSKEICFSYYCFLLFYPLKTKYILVWTYTNPAWVGRVGTCLIK